MSSFYEPWDVSMFYELGRQLLIRESRVFLLEVVLLLLALIRFNWWQKLICDRNKLISEQCLNIFFVDLPL